MPNYRGNGKEGLLDAFQYICRPSGRSTLKRELMLLREKWPEVANELWSISRKAFQRKGLRGVHFISYVNEDTLLFRCLTITVRRSGEVEVGQKKGLYGAVFSIRAEKEV